MTIIWPHLSQTSSWLTNCIKLSHGQVKSDIRSDQRCPLHVRNFITVIEVYRAPPAPAAPVVELVPGPCGTCHLSDQAPACWKGKQDNISPKSAYLKLLAPMNIEFVHVSAKKMYRMTVPCLVRTPFCFNRMPQSGQLNFIPLLKLSSCFVRIPFAVNLESQLIQMAWSYWGGFCKRFSKRCKRCRMKRKLLQIAKSLM